MEIQSQNVLITGANRGIGRAIAVMCAESGAHVHLAIRAEDQALVQELEKLGAASVKVWPVDLATREGAQKLIDQLGDQSIDILVNNAGMLTGGLLEEQPLDEIYRMLQVNLGAVVHLTHALLPGMLKRGRGKVVNNSSVTGVMHFPCASTYAASKAAVIAFNDSLALELKGTGVSTLCLLTPGVKTRMFDEIEKKYGKNFETPTTSLSPTQYAAMIKEAILLDLEHLTPRGVTGASLKVARHLPGVFKWAVGKRFKRD